MCVGGGVVSPLHPASSQFLGFFSRTDAKSWSPFCRLNLTLSKKFWFLFYVSFPVQVANLKIAPSGERLGDILTQEREMGESVFGGEGRAPKLFTSIS